MKKFLLSLCVAMLSIVGAWAQASPDSYGDATNGFTVTKDAESKTYTITGWGDLSTILGNNEVYTFTNTGSQHIYTKNGEEYIPVTQNSKYDSNVTYYQKVPTYVKATTEPNARETWTLKDGLNVYTKEGNDFQRVMNNSEIQDFSKSFVTIETAPASSDVFTTESQLTYSFNDAAEGVIYTESDGEYTQASGSYVPTTPYYKKTAGVDGEDDYYSVISEEDLIASYLSIDVKELQFASTKGIYYRDEWTNPHWVVDRVEDLIYDASKTYYKGVFENWNWQATGSAISYSELIAQGYLLTKRISSIADGNDVYVPNGYDYKKVVNGDYYDQNANYVTVTSTDIDNIKSDTYTTYKKKVSLQGSDLYTLNESNYTKVGEGDEYKEPIGGESQYYTYAGDGYNEVSLGDLIDIRYFAEWPTQCLTLTGTDLWSDLVAEIDGGGYTTVVVTSRNSDNPALICNHLTQAFMTSTKIRVLDMAGVAIPTIDSPFTSVAMTTPNQVNGVNKGTFMTGGNGMGENNSIETLYTPMVTAEHFELGVASFIYLPKLRYLHLSDGIEVLGESSIFARSFQLSQITFPNTLEVIKRNAVTGHFSANGTKLYDLDGNEIPYIETLTFPQSLKEIESGAFSGTCPKDVYFLGRTAPKVGRHAWGDDAYISNNAYELNVSEANSGIGVAVHMDKGEASRMNYLAQSGFLAMLHYPADCTPAEAARYTDPTRNYRRIVYNTYGKTEDQEIAYDPNDDAMYFNGTYTYYQPGKETSDIYGVSASTKKDPIMKAFGNEYPWPSASYTEEEWPQGYYGGDYSGGFYDVTKHGQYLWPSISMAMRATVVAQHALTWDGVTTIGDIIREKGDASFEGNGSEYEGLHQFVLSASDGNAKSTTEWDMDKYMDGKWHTVCLPFNMTKKQMKETWGPAKLDDDENPVYNIRLCEFSAVERGKDLITLKFNTEKFASTVNDDDIVLKAHISYMIKAEKAPAVEHITFNRYQIEPGAPKVTEIESTGEKADGTYRFVGNYVKVSSTTGQTVKMPQYTYFFSKTTGSFRFQVGTTGVWNPYSSVVEVPKGLDDYESYFTSSTDAGAKVATIYEEDDEATKIDVMMETNGELIYTNSDVFNLNGQKVGNNIEGLPAGIYIVKGKKYLVK